MTRKNTYLIFILFIAALASCQPKQLPVITILKSGPIGWNEKEDCQFVYTLASDSMQIPAKIKCRGGSSSRFYKHSFAVELTRKESLTEMTADDDWILNANYIDKTFMRHKISYDLFREMSPTNIASHCAYVNVNINRNYEGLYVLMEEINGGMIEINKKDTSAVLFKDPPIFYKDKLSWVQDSTNYYQQKFPKKQKLDKTAFIEEFQSFLFNSSDEEFNNQIQQRVDLGNVIDWHLILLFSNNSDGLVKNFFLYKLDQNTLLRFAIWDYDHSFGRDGDNEKNLMDRPIDCKRVILLKRLLESETIPYHQLLQKRWHELRKQNVFSLKNFESKVETNKSFIEKEVAKNFEKWPITDKNYFDSNNFQQELDLMLEFVAIRLQQLDKRFEFY